MNSKRSPNLKDEDVQTIIGIVDGWSGPLTWNSLIDAVYTRLYCRYTRQTLHKHQRIKIAFEVRKKNSQAGEPKVRGSVQIQKALERIALLEARIERLSTENDQLLEQFARWAFNAHVHGIAEAKLDRPLPEIDRRQTPVLVHSAAKRKGL